DAYRRLFTKLDELSQRLERQRYLVGDTITEADIRLFTTLVRFDPVYHGHFKCNRHKLAELPVLWAYARDLFQTPGFGDTVDFDHIKRHYYQVHTGVNPTQVVPNGPVLSEWALPHGREELGGRRFADGTPPGPPPPAETLPPQWCGSRQQSASGLQQRTCRGRMPFGYRGSRVVVPILTRRVEVDSGEAGAGPGRARGEYGGCHGIATQGFLASRCDVGGDACQFRGQFRES